MKTKGMVDHGHIRNIRKLERNLIMNTVISDAVRTNREVEICKVKLIASKIFLLKEKY